MTSAVVSLGSAVFLVVSILSFVGAFILIMSVRIGTRLIVVHQ